MLIEFTVPGPPRGKGRPRFTRAGHTYTPEETAAYENLVKLAYMQEAKGAKLTGPVTMRIIARMPIPTSLSAKRKAQLYGTPHVKKPDSSNIQKAVEDGLLGVAYHDDSSVWATTFRKVYCPDGEEVGLTVTLTDG